MKLAYLIANFPALSETFVSNEIGRLCRNNLDITVYSFKAPAAKDLDRPGKTARSLVERACYLNRLDCLAAAPLHLPVLARLYTQNRQLQKHPTGKPSPLMRLLRAVKLAAQLRKDGIEHLHAHWPYATEVAWLVHHLTGIPYSVSIHAHEVVHENGHFPLVFPSLSFATLCNQSAIDHLLSQLPADARSKSHLVYHGVDISDFAQLPFPTSSEPLRVVSAGRLTPTKGFDRLIRDCALARERGMEIKLALLGRGAEESHMREVATPCRFDQHLELPGLVSHSTVQAYLRRAHVLADTAFHDGLPNVVLEAMTTGRPVILSSLPASGEAVENGCEGFILAAPDDFEGFAVALRNLQDKPENAAHMASAARARVVTDHDAGRQISRLQNLFNQRQYAAST